MPKYAVKLSRTVRTSGDISIEADTLAEALEIIRASIDTPEDLFDQSTTIDWSDTGSQYIEEIVELETGRALPPIGLYYEKSGEVVSAEDLDDLMDTIQDYTHQVYSDIIRH